VTAGGRTNQRARTRQAIVGACRQRIESQTELSMRDIAAHALVSEATIYRYFPDLTSLLNETMRGVWPTGEEVVAPIAGETDPVRRVCFAAENFLRRALRYHRVIRAVISSTIAHPEFSGVRPGHRFPFIKAALDPVPDDILSHDRAERLAVELASVLSPGALFDLIDLCGLSEDDAVAVTLRIATAVTRVALGQDEVA
jgi:AcrR family transcriptional regulator